MVSASTYQEVQKAVSKAVQAASNYESSREISLVITKLQEAQLWLTRVARPVEE